MVQNNIPFDGLIDCSPASYIQRSDVVGWASEPAPDTSEIVSCRPVLFIDMMADRAPTACVPRVDGKEWNAKRAALYSMNCLSCPNAHEEWSRRCAFLTVALFLMPFSSSTAIAEEVPLASATICFDMT